MASKLAAETPLHGVASRQSVHQLFKQFPISNSFSNFISTALALANPSDFVSFQLFKSLSYLRDQGISQFSQAQWDGVVATRIRTTLLNLLSLQQRVHARRLGLPLPPPLVTPTPNLRVYHRGVDVTPTIHRESIGGMFKELTSFIGSKVREVFLNAKTADITHLVSAIIGITTALSGGATIRPGRPQPS